jgi:Tfp pilus assembly protein PilO
MNGSLDIKKILRENPLAVYGAAAAVIVFAAYIAIFMPLFRKISVKYAECRNYESQVQEARNLIECAYSSTDKICAGRTLISEREASTGINELVEFGKSLGINFAEIKPGDVISASNQNYKIMPLAITMQAPGNQFLEFMGRIDELKKAIVKMRSFNIAPDPSDRNTLNAHMVIDIYLSANP